MKLSAEDLEPLIVKLSHEERMRLARLLLASVAQPSARNDAEKYAKWPVNDEEFAPSTDDPLSWDAGGWDEFA